MAAAPAATVAAAAAQAARGGQAAPRVAGPGLMAAGSGAGLGHGAGGGPGGGGGREGALSPGWERGSPPAGSRSPGGRLLGMCLPPAGCEPSREDKIKLSQIFPNNGTLIFYYFFLLFFFFPPIPSRPLGGLLKFPSVPSRRGNVQNGGKEAFKGQRRAAACGSGCPVLPAAPPPLGSPPDPRPPALAAFPPAAGPAPGAGWLWKRLHGRQERLPVLQPSCLLDRNFKPDVFSHRAEICFCLSAKPIGNAASVAIRAGGACASPLFFILFFFF